jgi:thymidine phosphorylase
LTFRRALESIAAMTQSAELDAFLLHAKTQGLTVQEAAGLTRALVDSGQRLPTDSQDRVSMHSTGAPGSLTTLLCPPILASMGFPTPILAVDGGVSGAIDSLRVLEGFRASIPLAEAVEILKAVNLVHLGHDGGIFAPADRFLWTERERLGAKQVSGLIAASLLSKKLAMGASAGVVDVRVGPAGNAGSTRTEGISTAFFITQTANALGMRVACVVSDATTLQWPRVGRLDSLASALDIVTSPQSYKQHRHLRLAIAICAYGAAVLTGELVERHMARAWEAILSGATARTFQASCAAQGVSDAAVPSLRFRIERRKAVERSLDGLPDPATVGGAIRAARERVAELERDDVGVHVLEGKVALFLPRNAPEAAANGLDLIRPLHNHRGIGEAAVLYPDQERQLDV